MSLTGKLKDISFDDLLQMLSEQSRTGKLVFKWEKNKVDVIFHNGVITQVDSPTRKFYLKIGQLLLNNGVISQLQLNEALSAQAKDNLPLGTVLTRARKIPIKLLKKLLRVQFYETLYPIFNKPETSFEFDIKTLPPRSNAPTPINTQELILDFARYQDEWPLLRKKIPSPFSCFERKHRKKTSKPDFPAIQLKLYRILNPTYCVMELMCKIGRGEFETTRELVNLLNDGHIKRLHTLKKFGPNAHIRSSWWHDLGYTFFNLLVIGLCMTGIFYSYINYFWPDPRPKKQNVIPCFDHTRESLVEFHIMKIKNAIEVFKLRYGHYPHDLEELVAIGLLKKWELTYPDWQNSYFYVIRDNNYLILQPKR